jgi:hypothetical protein
MLWRIALHCPTLSLIMIGCLIACINDCRPINMSLGDGERGHGADRWPVVWLNLFQGCRLISLTFSPRQKPNPAIMIQSSGSCHE